MKIFLLSLFVTLQTVQLQPAQLLPVQGVPVYYCSKPAGEFIILATFKVKQKWNGEPQEQLITALEILRKQYPQANALLFTDYTMREAQALQLK